MKNFLLLFVSSLTLIGCTTGTSVPEGDTRYASVPQSHVQILSAPPSIPYTEIGVVSSHGAQLASDAQVYGKLQKAAADLGADAVIVQSAETRVYANLPAMSNTTTTANAYGSGSYNGYGDGYGNYNGTYNGFGTATAHSTTTYSPAQSFSGLNTTGIAIKYNTLSNPTPTTDPRTIQGADYQKR